jgi:hypothetical protein
MGYYRVNYDEATWEQLTSSLASLSNINRAGLADDALNLARAGLLRPAQVPSDGPPISYYYRYMYRKTPLVRQWTLTSTPFSLSLLKLYTGLQYNI